MNEHLRQRILRRIEALPDDRAYQILDYVEFLETKYAERSSPSATPFSKFTDAVEDKLRAGRISASAIADTVGLMNRAAGVLNSAMEATKSIANELATVPGALRTASSNATAVTTQSDSSSAAHNTKQPGSGEEKL